MINHSYKYKSSTPGDTNPAKQEALLPETGSAENQDDRNSLNVELLLAAMNRDETRVRTVLKDRADSSARKSILCSATSCSLKSLQWSSEIIDRERRPEPPRQP